MPRRIPIRVKLACALAVPIAGLVGGAAFQIVDATNVANEARAETDLAAAAVGPGSLVSQLQNERNYSSVHVVGMTQTVELPVASLEEARANTDAALAELRAFVRDRGAEADAAFAQGLAAVETGLAEVRGRIDTFAGPRSLDSNQFGDAIFQSYGGIIATLLDGSVGLALRIDDDTLRTGVELVDLSTRLYELRSQSLRTAVTYALAGDASLEARLDIAGRMAQSHAVQLSILQRATGIYGGFAEQAFGDLAIVRQDALLRGFTTTGRVEIEELLRTLESGSDSGVLLVRAEAARRLGSEAERLLADVDQERRTVIAVAGGAVLAALLLTVVVSRSITRPLASLTEQAQAMAGQRLPAAVKSVLETPLGEDVAIPEVEPVTVHTRDEVRDVAEALNVVQRSALDLAVEQAVLRRNIADSFVNMGRRNQNLLDRQLDFITDLEREEREPERLASLFRLDHLATRMRRNAESLLRLAGSEPQRQMSAPIELADVVRGALGEVEDFQRVEVRGMDPAAVAGGVGADLAHAVAELLENALSFSPPSEPVEVRGRRTPDGYVLAIADAGLGMTPDELLVANRRLAGEESFTVAPSRYLGHYVAGHLASRLGVRIELQPGPAGGLIARMDIPASLLLELPARAPTPMPAAEPEPAPVRAASDTAAWMATDTPFVDADEPVVMDEPAPVEPVAPAEPIPPSPLFTPAAPPAPAMPAAETTPSGLVRRVPGAQRPRTEIGPRANGHTPADDERMSAEAVSSFLSDFNAGVARGIAEAGHNPWEEGSR